MSEINRGLDHMANQLRNWSPGRAVLPPDHGCLNRALDRAAAEHLREVAPHLASCLSCQAGLCAEHGPTVTAGGLVCRNCGGAGRYAGATDPRDGTIEWLACPCTAPAPPQPERTAETCFCGHCEYERDRRESPPAPPVEAKGEMSPPHGIICDKCLAGTPHERDRHCYSIAQLMEHIAALRTRAREAESFAAHWIARAATVLRERDEAREQREDLANEILAERSDLAAANARAEKAERHNLWWSNRTKAAEDERDAREAQRAACYADLTTERAARVARHRAYLDPACVARLESVIQRTGCVLVLSSSWRYDVTPEEMTARLRERGAPSAEVIDSTLLASQMPSGLYAGAQRGFEVDEWLERNGADAFAIVDDDADLWPHMARLVQTSWETGLQDEHVERLVALLGAQ